MRHRSGILGFAAAAIILSSTVGGAGARAPEPGRETFGQPPAPARVAASPVCFVENRGQTDARVAYYARGSGMDVFFTAEGITWALGRPGDRWAVKADFLEGRPSMPSGGERTPMVMSWFRGAPSQWIRGVPTFRDVTWSEVWPGIDLVVSAGSSCLKSLWVVRPGADPSRIAFLLRGPREVRVTAEGELEVETPRGTFRDARPVAWQERNGLREEVPVAHEAGRVGKAWRTGFALGAYDPSRALTIDPVVILYSGLIGGSGYDSPNSVAVSADGHVYITGYSTSSEPSFPVTAGPDLTANGGEDAFVACLNPDGQSLLYAGFIGGSGDQTGEGIAIDGSGNAWVVGKCSESTTGFPTVVGPDLTANGGFEAFVAKVSPDGTNLTWSGFRAVRSTDPASPSWAAPTCRRTDTASAS